MKKVRIIRTVLAVALVLALTLTLAACGKKNEQSQAEDPTAKSFTIGFNLFGSGSPIFESMGDEIEYTLRVLGMKGSRVSDEFSPDIELQNIQNFTNAGVDGIVMQIAAPPVLPPAANAAAAAEIPFVLSIFACTEADRADLAANNAFYAGAATNETYGDGYIIGQIALRAGYKTACLIGGNMGEIHGDERIAGFTQSFATEGGGKILDIARCNSPAECQEKATAMLSANRDVDCLYTIIDDYVAGSVNAMDALGLTDIPIYTSNISPGTDKYIKEGRVAVGSAGQDLAVEIATILLINRLDGHPILDPNGKAPEIKVIPFYIDSSNVDDFISIFFTPGTHPFTEDLLKSLTWRFNNDVSYKTFTDLTDSGLTLEALLKAHGR